MTTNLGPKLEASLRFRLDPATFYAWLGGTSLLLLVILIPPFQVPDEPQHFFRSYQLSRFEIWSRMQGAVAGSELPASLPDLVERFMGTNELHTARPLNTQRLTDTLQERYRRLDSEKTVFADFSSSAYAPLPYIPQALSIAVGRSLGAGPLELLYIARFANALSALLISWCALRLFPIGREFALLIALLPMTQYQTASLSPDALTIAGALLFTAIMARFLVYGEWSSRKTFAALLAGALMCSVKPVYVPLLFAGVGALLAPSHFARQGLRSAVLWQVAGALLIIVLVMVWLGSNSGVVVKARAGNNIAEQFGFVLNHPFKFAAAAFRSLADLPLAAQVVGILGWLSLKLPRWLYVLVALAFPLSVLADTRRTGVPLATALWLLLLSAVSVILVELALYVYWTPVGGSAVEGVQGRYLIPLLPMVGVSLTSLAARRAPLANVDLANTLLLIILGVSTVTMHFAIALGYGLF